MSRAKIVWFSESGKPLKMISLRKWVIQLFVGTSLFLLILSLVLIFLTRMYANKMEITQAKNRQLNERIARQREKIQSLEHSVVAQNKTLSQLKAKLRKSHRELREIREMEIKLRRFLDLKHKKPLSEEHSHQGGFTMKGSTKAVDISLGNATSRMSSQQVVSYSLSLKESLSQVVRSLKEKKEQLRHTPSVLPVKGEDVWLSSDFGRRVNPMTGRREFHSGIDVAGGYKTPIIAPAQGKVYEIGKSRLLGNYVQIRHTKDLRTTYGHLHSFATKEGKKVDRGEVIGYMGNTGRSTGTHVHYEVVKGDKARNPMQYILDRKGETLSLR